MSQPVDAICAVPPRHRGSSNPTITVLAVQLMDVLEVFRRAMSKAAVRLRAQKAYSTDPEYLERMAAEEEAREHHTPRSRGDEPTAICESEDELTQA